MYEHFSNSFCFFSLLDIEPTLKGEIMKEFGVREGLFYYVVYPAGCNDYYYEFDKKEIMNKWDGLTKQDIRDIVEKCVRNNKPFEGIPHDEEHEVLAIVISFEDGVGASFLRFVPNSSVEISA